MDVVGGTADCDVHSSENRQVPSGLNQVEFTEFLLLDVAERLRGLWTSLYYDYLLYLSLL